MANLKEINAHVFANRLKMIMTDYFKEFKYLKLFILFVVLAIILSYSVYIFFNIKTVSNLGDEDHFFEWMTAIFFWTASVFFFLTYLKTKNLIFLIVALFMFFAAGEEISWGQRLFGFKTPEVFDEINVQKEFNLHNIVIFNTVDFQGHHKSGLSRLLEINFLFRLFSLLCGIVLPFCVYHFKFISGLTRKIKVPVPPISIGLFFFINWITYVALYSFILPKDSPLPYVEASGEIFECVAAFIILINSFYFYKKYEIIPIGNDIKQVI